MSVLGLLSRELRLRGFASLTQEFMVRVIGFRPQRLLRHFGGGLLCGFVIFSTMENVMRHGDFGEDGLTH